MRKQKVYGNKVCIITNPFESQEGATPTILSGFIYLMETISSNLHVITGNYPNKKDNSAKIIRITGLNGQKTILSRILRFLIMQIVISYQVIKVRRGADLFIFFLGARTLICPMIVAKLFQKRTIIIFVGSLIGAKYCGKRSLVMTTILDKIPYAFAEFNYVMCDRIIVYSKTLLNDSQLKRHLRKSLIAHRHYLNFNTFIVTTSLPDRFPLVGYVGRLSGEKGIQHFVQALPTILNNQQELRVLIGGDGELRDSIEASLQEGGVDARVDLPGWIPHEDLPGYLNQLRLLILPSYTEGLPNIMLEAMACGTPVLATPVGAIPDVIIDGKTGFIMENNSPECIAENVIRALTSSDLGQIAENGRRFVEEHFMFEKVVENWKRVLQEIP